MNVLFATAECEPFAKTGGLGDVGSALPAALEKKDVDIRVIMPFYQVVSNYFDANPDLELKMVFQDLEVSFEKFYLGMKKIYSFNILESKLISNPNVPIYFVDIPEFFNRPKLYVDEKGKVFPDSAEIFAYFSKALFEFLDQSDWFPDVIHCNDWHTGLIPLLVKQALVRPKKEIKTVISIHNMAYQGTFPLLYADKLGFTANEIILKEIIKDGKLNFLKAGITTADIVTTVSETYRNELLTNEFGYGLEDILKERIDSFYGILNGVNYDDWNPATDKHITANYTIEDITGKKICKTSLWSIIKKYNQKADISDDKIPIFAMVTRLEKQKGIDLLINTLPDILKEKIHLVIVGSGNKKLEESLKEFKDSDNFTFIMEFNYPLSHQVEAGADFFLMPSKFEPCGLSQMYSLKYGTIPIVRKTGGLADTVKDLENDGNGFVFEEFTEEELFKSIKRAINFYYTTKEKNVDIIRKKGMVQDFSWDKQVKKYLEVYGLIIDNK